MLKRLAKDHRLLLFAVAGALIVRTIRGPSAPTPNFTWILAHYLLDPSGLLDSAWVEAVRSGPYSIGAFPLAFIVSLLTRITSAPVDIYVGALEYIFWAWSIITLYRLTRFVTDSHWGAFLTSVFYGIQVPLGWSDAPISLQSLDRSMAVPAYFISVHAFLSGRLRAAWIWAAVSTYLHGHPGVYLWPVFVCEDLWKTVSKKRTWRDFGGRLLLGIALGLPLLLMTRSNLHNEVPLDFALMSAKAISRYMTGYNLMGWFDWLFVVLGMGLILALMYSYRKSPHARALARASAVAALLFTSGALAYSFAPADSFIYGFFTKLQPIGGMFIFELTGMILFPAWMVGLLRRDILAGLPTMASLVVSAIFYDPILRLLAFAAAGLQTLSRPAFGIWILAATALISLANALAPGQIAAALGDRAGALKLAVFQPGTGLAIAAAFAAAAFARRMPKPAAYGKFLPVLAIALLSLATRLRYDQPLSDYARMAHWIRANTPRGSVVLHLPTYAISCREFVSRANRPEFACDESISLAFHFGASGIKMIGKLQDLGVDFSTMDLDARFAEFDRLGKSLDENALAGLRKKHRIDYLIKPSDWDPVGTPVHRIGNASLYRLSPL